MTKPDPSDEIFRSGGAFPPRFWKKSSKNSSNGEPFGTLGRGTPCGPFCACVVEILTTASLSRSASGASDGGGTNERCADAFGTPAANPAATTPSNAKIEYRVRTDQNWPVCARAWLRMDVSPEGVRAFPPSWPNVRPTQGSCQRNRRNNSAGSHRRECCRGYNYFTVILMISDCTIGSWGIWL